MNLAIAQELFKAGDLIQARIEPVLIHGGFTLVLVRRDGSRESLTRTKTKDMKIYKRDNGAKQDAAKIGFKEVSLLFD
ncbi:hypothetical protein [Aliikangiella maris]|uniref:Uncharacterized protein n=2 Tax=Aliikangiella maris TaxID=3162458 RepID=A0ABV2BYI1_9GAMM